MTNVGAVPLRLYPLGRMESITERGRKKTCDKVCQVCMRASNTKYAKITDHTLSRSQMREEVNDRDSANIRHLGRRVTTMHHICCTSAAGGGSSRVLTQATISPNYRFWLRARSASPIMMPIRAPDPPSAPQHTRQKTQTPRHNDWDTNVQTHPLGHKTTIGTTLTHLWM